MKRFLMLVGVAAVAGAMYVAASPASQQSRGPTLAQFNALKKQVASLSKSEKALKKLVKDCVQIAIPINQFGDNTSAQTEGYIYGQGGTPAAPGTVFYTTALDVTSVSDTGSVWFVGVGGDKRSACTADLGESVLRHGAARAGTRHASSLRSWFTAHGR
jgi:hypothetical protein